MIDTGEILKALDRIARTADGEHLYRYLQREALSLPQEEASDGALRGHSERRRFALTLMKAMEKGIDESAARRSDSSSPGIAERAAVFASRPAARVSGGESFREYARRTDPELSRPGDAKPAAG